MPDYESKPTPNALTEEIPALPSSHITHSVQEESVDSPQPISDSPEDIDLISLPQAIDAQGLPCSELPAESQEATATPAKEIVLGSEIERTNQTDFCNPRPGPGPAKLKGRARFEAWLETLVSKNRFCRKILTIIYLPLAFHSGLRMKKVGTNSFTYVLPFRRFNKNWYKAMAGAALVANSEIAAGLYLMAELKGQWTVVCRHMSYRFLQPCFGPAIYRMVPNDELAKLMSAGQEFNIDLVIDIIQQVSKRKSHQRKVGRCNITFHITPKNTDGNMHIRKRHLSRLRHKMTQ